MYPKKLLMRINAKIEEMPLIYCPKIKLSSVLFVIVASKGDEVKKKT